MHIVCWDFIETGVRTIFSRRVPVKVGSNLKDNSNSPLAKFHQFLFPFSNEFSDLNFASYVLYNLPELCHMTHTGSLGYLWFNMWFMHEVWCKVMGNFLFAECLIPKIFYFKKFSNLQWENDFTPSLGHFLLDVCNPGGEMAGETPISKIMSAGILVVKFKFKY